MVIEYVKKIKGSSNINRLIRCVEGNCGFKLEYSGAYNYDEEKIILESSLL